MKKEVIRFTVPVVIKYDSISDRDRAIDAARKDIKFHETWPGDFETYSLTPTLQKNKKRK